MSQNEWEEQERIYGCWLCNCPDIGNRQLNLLTEICGGSEAAYFADSETWGKALSPKQVERLKAHTAGWRPKEEYQRILHFQQVQPQHPHPQPVVLPRAIKSKERR